MGFKVDGILELTEDGVEGLTNKNPHAGQPCLTFLAMRKIVLWFSNKFDLLSHPKYLENPGMVDAGKFGGKISHASKIEE